MSVSSLGIGSGLDLESLVQGYVVAEGLPAENRLVKKEEELTLELSGVSSFKSALSQYNSVLNKLSDPDAFNKQVITTGSEAISVETNGFASNGSFDIEVKQLATGSKLQTQNFADALATVGSGTLTFGAGSDSFAVDIDASDSLTEIRNKINENSDNFGVTANIINEGSQSYLVYTSTVTGSANQLTVSSSDASLQGIAENNVVKQTSQDAIITVDGSGDITSDSNEFKNVIQDVTITAKEVTASTSLDIAQDSENGKELINEFINGFNSLMDSITGLGAPELGRLAFDSSLRSAKQQLTNTVINSVSGLTGGINSLSDIGIDLNRYGKLEISTLEVGGQTGQEKLDYALNNKLSEVSELFSSESGLAVEMSETVDFYIGSNGTLLDREKSLNSQIDDLDQEWEDLAARLTDYENTLRKQFTFLDQTVANFNATGDWLTSTLSNLNKSND